MRSGSSDLGLSLVNHSTSACRSAARAINGRFWFFYGALSDVDYQITVTDTVTGDSRTYHNPPGEICGAADTDAFRP